MSKIFEDQVGFESSLAKGPTTAGHLIGKAGKLVGQINDLKIAQDKKTEAEEKAEAEAAEKTAARDAKVAARHRRDRALRKQVRDEEHAEKEAEQKKKDQTKAEQIRDGYIFEDNYRVAYKWLLLNLDKDEITKRFAEGKISVDVLKKMIRYQGVLAKAFKGIPGGIATAIRHKKFNPNAPMVFNTNQNDKAAKASIFSFVQQQFAPNNKPKNFNLAAWRESVKHISSPNLDHHSMFNFRLDYAGAVYNFNQMLQHDDAASMVYSLIIWFDEAFTNFASKGFNPHSYDGTEDFNNDPNIEREETAERVKFFSLEFFEFAAQYLSLLRMENNNMLSVMESCLHQGAQESPTASTTASASTAVQP